MNLGLQQNSNEFTVRTGIFADWIDSCVRNNIETALITFAPYRVVNPLGGRPYHVSAAHIGLMLRELNKFGGYHD